MKHVKLLLKTLFSNNACVEAARTKEVKYNIFAIVFALLALFLSVLPTSITAFNKKGSDWVSGTTYGVEMGLFNFTNDTSDKIVFNVIKDEKTNKSYLKKVENWKDVCKEETSITSGENRSFVDGIERYVTQISQEGRTPVNFEVYYYDNNEEKSDENFVKFVTYLINGLNPVKRLEAELAGTKDIKDENYYMYYTEKDGKKTLKPRQTSFLAFGKEHIFGYMYTSASTSAVANFGGDYNSMEYPNLLGSLKGQTPTASLENWKAFFNKSYEITRWNSAWSTTGIMCGVNGGIILFMGLMVFILTRGKNNPFRIYSFWDGQKIAYYAAFTPGVIGMALSFALTNMAMMFFVLIFGIRVMWLSMRTLKPAQ